MMRNLFVQHHYKKYWGHDQNHSFFQDYGHHEYYDKYSERRQGTHRHYHYVMENDNEFIKLKKIMYYSRPLIIIFYIIVLYFLFKWSGFKALVILLAVLLVLKGIFYLYFANRLEKQIFQPLALLEQGFQNIAAGQYHVHLETASPNQFNRLIASFNTMAEKLEASEKSNQAYEKNRKALIANISHDLKTPITVVQGYLEMILNGDVTNPDQVRKYLQIVQNNTIYINKLIDDLFLFSKLDMDRLDLKLELVQARAFMADLMNEFALELKEMQVEFHYADLLQNDEQINIDGKRICQAVRNVIGNAVRYGPDQGLKIEVSLYKQGFYLCLDIKDNGPGIAATEIEAVFKRFYRIDNERSKNLNSTGLGLAIAQELLEAHEGRITVESQENQGACFTLWIPQASQPKGEDTP